jgi:hypothetical protein
MPFAELAAKGDGIAIHHQVEIGFRPQALQQGVAHGTTHEGGVGGERG